MYKLKLSLVMLAVSVSLLACLKDERFLDVSKTQPIIEFAFGTNAESDLGNFGLDPTADVLDTAIAVNIASPQVLDYPVTVTLKVDQAAIDKYNGVAGNTALTVLPDSTFQFTTTTVTIPAGHRIARIPLTLFPTKIDATKSYGLPISIVSATGPNGQNLVVSGNAGVALYAFIGNPIAGVYNEEWIRWASFDTTTAPALHFTNNPVLVSAKSPTEVDFSSALNGAGFSITFDNNAGVLSNFQVTLDPSTYGTFGAASITKEPTIIRADPVHGVYRFYFQYVNTSGASRTIVEEFAK